MMCSGEILPCIELCSNAEDVYHVGITIAQRLTETEIVVQLKKSFREGSKLLLLSKLLEALQSDPDLHAIPSVLRPQSVQSLYVCTGCDYVSFSRGMGKVSFLSTFFQYASFSSEAPGSIGEVTLDEDSPACLSFFRLVGATYFTAHASAFEFCNALPLCILKQCL